MKVLKAKYFPKGMPMAQPPSDRVIRSGFFTTKPTGQGTGLGLSIAYDIIKAHGGEIKIQALATEAAQTGTIFIIHLSV